MQSLAWNEQSFHHYNSSAKTWAKQVNALLRSPTISSPTTEICMHCLDCTKTFIAIGCKYGIDLLIYSYVCVNAFSAKDTDEDNVSWLTSYGSWHTTRRRNNATAQARDVLTRPMHTAFSMYCRPCTNYSADLFILPMLCTVAFTQF